MIYEQLIWFKHASFLWDGSKKIYFDPWEIDGLSGKADLILVTHSHYDHCDSETIDRLRRENTIIIASHDCSQKLNGNIKTLVPGKKIKIGGVEIESVPSYNIDKPFHPKENNWLGYVVSVDGIKIYHAGDTDRIPEMKNIATDLALLPVGGTYTMNWEEAAKAVRDIDLKLAIPMHYGYIIGAQKDGRNFVEKLGKKAEALIPIIPFEKE